MKHRSSCSIYSHAYVRRLRRAQAGVHLEDEVRDGLAQFVACALPHSPSACDAHLMIQDIMNLSVIHRQVILRGAPSTRYTPV